MASNGSSGVKRLVIVESATKARKIAPYLGPDYIVEASVGHIRDLPRGAADVPAKHKKEPWARLGVNVDDDFEPLYVVSPDKKKKVADLKAKLKQVDELYLATDPDREGEAIAWHLLQVLKPTVPVRRMVFHEITKPAILAAAENTRELDHDLVDAQETRRVLDRLYGYEVSPVLWKKVMPRLSAGRVQSVATRVIVERERERMAFIAADYWDLTAHLRLLDGAGVSGEGPREVDAKLARIDGTRVAQGRDFTDRGEVRTKDVRVLDKTAATALADGLRGREMRVSAVEEKPYTRRPYPPFMTSTLQQEAGRKLHFTSERTMRIAQRLYENGHITYMRTDSTTLSTSGINAARAQAAELYGERFVADAPRQYTRKVKNSQEAHEAIRPAGETFATPGQLSGRLDAEEFKLYELIWQRTVASQMADARGTSVKVTVTGQAGSGETCDFTASGRTITFPGFLKAYVETTRQADGRDVADNAERHLPVLARATACPPRRSAPTGTRRPLRPATPRPASSRRWRSSASAARRRTRRSSRRSRTGGTSSRAGTRWSRRGSRSPSSASWRTTSGRSSTTTSRRRWRMSSTTSPPAGRTGRTGSGASTSGTRVPPTRPRRRWPGWVASRLSSGTTWSRSTRGG